jgi:hypothetical protein
MSHIASGFCVTDIQALAMAVKSQCPDLELVRQKTYRTWITDHGRLVGDYPLPGLYQVKLMAALKKQGVDVHAKAKAQGVTLPADLLELEHKPWNAAEQHRLLQDPAISSGYQRLTKDVVGKDAEFVIRVKGGKEGKDPSAYEIGLVPHPTRKGEFVMMTDFFAQGNGLLQYQGVGQYTRKGGTDSWGGELKQAYAVRAAERAIVSQIQAGNPEYGSYTRTVLADGRVKFEVQPRH